MKAHTAYKISKKHKNPSNIKELFKEIRTAAKLNYYSLVLEFTHKPKIIIKLKKLGYYVYYYNKKTMYICWEQNDKM